MFCYQIYVLDLFFNQLNVSSDVFSLNKDEPRLNDVNLKFVITAL